MMDSHFIPEFAVLGHPNEGKSSVVSTLAEDDSVKVSPTPGETTQCRIFPVKIDGEEFIRFTDTPGFQSPRQTLKWMQEYSGDEKDRLRTFCKAHQTDPAFSHECELFSPLLRGAGIIFVVDGSRPIRKNDRMEMEILRLTGHPRMAIINSKKHEEAFLDAWKEEFRKSFNAVRVFNAHNANYAERIALLESLKAIDQDWQPALERVISTFKQDWANRNTITAEIICDLLIKCLRHTVVRRYTKKTAAKYARDQELQSIYREEIAAIEKNACNRIRRLFKHNIFQKELPSQSIVNAPLFAKRTWQVLGLSPLQLAAAAGVSGGIIGAGLDLAAAGLTFGVFTAIGSAIGAGSALFWGEQISKAKMAGISLGGYRVSIGPNESANFPYILLDRALIYYSLVINWAHGRRDYPEDETTSQKEDEDRKGFTAAWSTEQKRVSRAFLKTIGTGDDASLENARKKMIALLLETMSEISQGSENLFKRLERI